MSRFSSEKKIVISLFSAKEDGTPIEDKFMVREKIPYTALQDILMKFDADKPNENLKLNIPILQAAIVGWDLKDDNGESVPCTPEKIADLDFQTVTDLVPRIIDLYGISKKNEPVS